MDGQPKFVKITQFYEREHNTGEWKQKWGKLWDGTEIDVVDGFYVRGHPEFDYIDYTEGGNSEVYGPSGEIANFMPSRRIWVEDMKSDEDDAFDLIHEISEHLVMKILGWKYNKAHDRANSIEKSARYTYTKSGLPAATKLLKESLLKLMRDDLRMSDTDAETRSLYVVDLFKDAMSDKPLSLKSVK